MLALWLCGLAAALSCCLPDCVTMSGTAKHDLYASAPALQYTTLTMSPCLQLG